MADVIPLISVNIAILRFLSLIYVHDWRRYVGLCTTSFLVFTQLNYMINTDDGVSAIIRNSYMVVLWVNTIIRAYVLLYDHRKYELLIDFVVKHYRMLESIKSKYIQDLLRDITYNGRRLAFGNLFLGMMTCLGFAIHPLFSTERVLPFGSLIPGVNELQSPFYEVWYIYEILITPTGCCMYIPYTSLVAQFIMFAILMCKVLQHNLRQLNNADVNLEQHLITCIKYQINIYKYVEYINGLIGIIFLLEFLAFGTLLCALLFLLNIVDTTVQILIVCAYIIMIFSQIYALYWFANDLREESLGVAAAAYEINWIDFNDSVKKMLLLVIMRAQHPTSIRIGGVYPITLQLFQSLLNVSYSYFTFLKRVYN